MVFNIITYEGSANWNHNEMPKHTHQNEKEWEHHYAPTPTLVGVWLGGLFGIIY